MLDKSQKSWRQEMATMVIPMLKQARSPRVANHARRPEGNDMDTFGVCCAFGLKGPFFTLVS